MQLAPCSWHHAVGIMQLAPCSWHHAVGIMHLPLIEAFHEADDNEAGMHAALGTPLQQPLTYDVPAEETVSNLADVLLFCYSCVCLQFLSVAAAAPAAAVKPMCMFAVPDNQRLPLPCSRRKRVELASR
jgi:hypothetical protein